MAGTDKAGSAGTKTSARLCSGSGSAREGTGKTGSAKNDRARFFGPHRGKMVGTDKEGSPPDKQNKRDRALFVRLRPKKGICIKERVEPGPCTVNRFQSRGPFCGSSHWNAAVIWRCSLNTMRTETYLLAMLLQ